MTKANKSSSLLFFTILLLLVFICSGMLFSFYLAQSTENDAEMINKLGIIRGSIQRMVKLELAGQESIEVVKIIDDNINEFLLKRIKIHDQDDKIKNALDNLIPNWNELKEARETFRIHPTAENQKSFYRKSEEVWINSNAAVLASQLVSEHKAAKYKINIILLTLNIPLSILILFLIKKYVRDNLEYHVNYDALTKIYNRRFFTEVLENEIKKQERSANKFSFIMFDIDFFKKINDQFGHDIGDSVLLEISQLVKFKIRKGDLLARLGGEEFGILTFATDLDDAYNLAEKLRKIVQRHQFSHADYLTISLGVTEYSNGDNANEIYKRADIALYKAKNSGRNKTEKIQRNP